MLVKERTDGMNSTSGSSNNIAVIPRQVAVGPEVKQYNAGTAVIRNVIELTG